MACIVTRLLAGKSGTGLPSGPNVLKNVQRSSGVHPASYSIDTRGSLLDKKRNGCKAYSSARSSAEIKTEWSFTYSTPARAVTVLLSHVHVQLDVLSANLSFP
jgi:hypothetical protein